MGTGTVCPSVPDSGKSMLHGSGNATIHTGDVICGPGELLHPPADISYCRLEAIAAGSILLVDDEVGVHGGV